MITFHLSYPIFSGYHTNLTSQIQKFDTFSIPNTTKVKVKVKLQFLAPSAGISKVCTNRVRDPLS